MTFLYKHKNNTDVAIEVVKSYFVKETSVYKLKVVWWNIGLCHDPVCMGIVQRIKLTKQQWLKEWEILK